MDIVWNPPNTQDWKKQARERFCSPLTWRNNWNTPQVDPRVCVTSSKKDIWLLCEGLPWAFLGLPIFKAQLSTKYSWSLIVKNSLKKLQEGTFWVEVSNIFYSYPYLGRWSDLTRIFCRWMVQLIRKPTYVRDLQSKVVSKHRTGTHPLTNPSQQAVSRESFHSWDCLESMLFCCFP